MPSLSSLVVELLTKILLFLDWRTIIRLKQVSADFKAIIDGSIELQYAIELGVHGMLKSMVE